MAIRLSLRTYLIAATNDSFSSNLMSIRKGATWAIHKKKVLYKGLLVKRNVPKADLQKTDPLTFVPAKNVYKKRAHKDGPTKKYQGSIPGIFS